MVARKDGDLVFLTDNSVLTNNVRELPTIFCIQRNSDKIDPSEEDLVKSNILGFGDEIGKITNRVTSMFDVMSMYQSGSEEHKTLEYRIMCGQLYQQNAIDKIKGIVAKPMAKSWYDRHAIPNSKDIEDEGSLHEAELYRKVVADKKPYFMRYVYADLMKDYKKYIRAIEANCGARFGMTVQQLKEKDPAELTHEQRGFLYYVKRHYPVSMHDCVMNRICRRFEEEFDGIMKMVRQTSCFDYTFLKADCEYGNKAYYSVRDIYAEFSKWRKAFLKRASDDRLNAEMRSNYRGIAIEMFQRHCSDICSNSAQAMNIVLDMCYKSDGGKQFAWDLFGDCIIDNLLAKNDNVVHYPAKDPDGDILFGGERFSMKQMEVCR